MPIDHTGRPVPPLTEPPSLLRATALRVLIAWIIWVLICATIGILLIGYLYGFDTPLPLRLRAVWVGLSLGVGTLGAAAYLLTD